MVSVFDWVAWQELNNVLGQVSIPTWVKFTSEHSALLHLGV